MYLCSSDWIDHFQCVCGQCPDTCCAAWQIILDEETCQTYQQLPGEFGDYVRSCMRTGNEETWFQMKNGACPMLTKDGLCQIHMQIGPQATSQVCRTYPRWEQTYGNRQEIGLCLSCPEVVRMLLQRHEPLQFSTIQEERPITQYHNLDARQFFLFLSARTVCLEISRDRSRSLEQRCRMLLTFGKQLQGHLFLRRMRAAEQLVQQWSDPACRYADGTKRFYRRERLFGRITPIFRELERLSPQWDRLLRTFRPGTEENWQILKKQAGTNPIVWEHVLTYFLRKYTLQACYDGDFLGKVKFAVISWLYPQELSLFCRERDGVLTDETRIDLIHRYCREIENSEENMTAILKALGRNPAFDTDRLLSLL